MKLSVIICTHNPKGNHLSRTLDALKNQTLHHEDWELLLIDNASKTVLAEEWDLSWHPLGRHIREDQLGLTPARLRGIREAKGDLLLFVDDDNLLEPDYLETALQISIDRPYVGAFGGNIEGDFEGPVPSWIEPYLECLAVRSIKQTSWACRPGTQAIQSAPCGAGMVVRKEVAAAYADLICNDDLRRSLDRTGMSLSSGGDTDMALCACKLGMAVGVFPELKMAHIIPAGRMTLEYTLRLARGITSSYYILCYLWDGTVPEKPFVQRITSEKLIRFLRTVKRLGRFSETEKITTHIQQARALGVNDAYNTIIKICHQPEKKWKPLH